MSDIEYQYLVEIQERAKKFAFYAPFKTPVFIRIKHKLSEGDVYLRQAWLKRECVFTHFFVAMRMCCWVHHQLPLTQLDTFFQHGFVDKTRTACVIQPHCSNKAQAHIVIEFDLTTHHLCDGYFKTNITTIGDVSASELEHIRTILLQEKSYSVAKINNKRLDCHFPVYIRVFGFYDGEYRFGISARRHFLFAGLVPIEKTIPEVLRVPAREGETGEYFLLDTAPYIKSCLHEKPSLTAGLNSLCNRYLLCSWIERKVDYDHWLRYLKRKFDCILREWLFRKVADYDWQKVKTSGLPEKSASITIYSNRGDGPSILDCRYNQLNDGEIQQLFANIGQLNFYLKYFNGEAMDPTCNKTLAEALL